MEYMTVKEASKIWNLSPRRIQTLCVEGRIKGALKMSVIWMIPKETQKPKDERIKNGEYKNWRKKEGDNKNVT